MARVIMLLVGLVLLAVGVLGCYLLRVFVWQLIIALLAIVLVLLGLLVVILAISEFAGPRNGSPPVKAEMETTESRE